MRIQNKRCWLTVVACGLMFASGTALYYVSSAKQEQITPFVYKRDMADLAAVFEQSRYWLTSTPDYSIEYAMRYKSPHNSAFYWGQLDTDVLRSLEDTLIGFVSYYMKNRTEGDLLFLAVDKKFRRQGYAEILMRYGIKALAGKGARVIHLVTRPTNQGAIKLYDRVGFHETGRDAEYVYFSCVPSGIK